MRTFILSLAILFSAAGMAQKTYTVEELQNLLLATTSTPLHKPDSSDIDKLKAVFTPEHKDLHRTMLSRLKFAIETYGLQANLLPLKQQILDNVPECSERMQVIELYDLYSSLMQGTLAPTPVLKDAAGKEHTFADYRGKMLIIDVWATWCGSCLEKMPDFMKIRDEFSDRPDIMFLTVSIDRRNKRAEWLAAIEKYGMNGMVNLFPDAEGTSDFETLYQVQNVPRYMIIAKDGSIITAYAEHPLEDLRKQILLASTRAEEGIQFMDTTFVEACRIAQESGKLLFIDCYTKTCVPCRYMARNIFPQKTCGDFFNPRFVSLMKDMEEGDGVEIAKTYGVRVYPTYLVLLPDGTLRVFAEGATKDPVLFNQRIESLLELADMRDSFAAGKRDEAFLDEYFQKLKQYVPQELPSVIEATMMDWPVERVCQISNWKWVAAEVKNVESPIFRRLLSEREAFAAQVGEEDLAHHVLAVYQEEFRVMKMMDLNFDLRIADLQFMESQPGYEDARRLRLCMQVRQINNLKQADRAQQVAAALNEATDSIADERQRMSVIRELSGYQRCLTTAEQKGAVSAALQRFADNLPDNLAPMVLAVKKLYD